jgi:hypothetical protein
MSLNSRSRRMVGCPRSAPKACLNVPASRLLVQSVGRFQDVRCSIKLKSSDPVRSVIFSCPMSSRRRRGIRSIRFSFSIDAPRISLSFANLFRTSSANLAAVIPRTRVHRSDSGQESCSRPESCTFRLRPRRLAPARLG